ncbi:MAG: hypothetical protein K2K98_11530 [Muribaculaceae bacterium]|nr:hypothetical protein [Muribaculaceae bacterium]
MAKRLDDFNGIFSFEKSFKEWLEDIFTSTASSDYPARLRKFFTQYYQDDNMLFNGMSIYRCLNLLPIGQIQLWFDICLIQAENISDKKERLNIKSAINKYRVYIEQLNTNRTSTTYKSSCIKKSEKEVEEIRKLNEHIRSDRQLTFSKNELGKIFLSQFRTEDRRLTAKKGIIYPIKAIGPFINREIGDRNLMTRFFNEHIDRIKILLGPSKSCLFKDIKRLTLESPDSDNLRMVSVSVKGNKELVYTQDENRIIPLRVKSSSDINRDHDKAISNILENLDLKVFPSFHTVSEACRKTKSKTPTSIQKSLRKILAGKDSKVFALELYKEIEILFQQLSFTLMEGCANRKKSSSV